MIDALIKSNRWQTLLVGVALVVGQAALNYFTSAPVFSWKELAIAAGGAGFNYLWSEVQKLNTTTIPPATEVPPVEKPPVS